MSSLYAELTFFIPHAASLKDKRRIVRGIIDKTRHKFNASVAEVDTQDILKTLTIGVAVVSGDVSHTRSMLDAIVRFMEEHADAELSGVKM